MFVTAPFVFSWVQLGASTYYQRTCLPAWKSKSQSLKTIRYCVSEFVLCCSNEATASVTSLKISTDFRHNDIDNGRLYSLRQT